MTSEETSGLRVGADIGGTFTDLVFKLADGRLDRRKVPSTPDDYSRAIVDGIAAFCNEEGIDPASISEVVHATTVATNAILERKGARTALLTTDGFRDVLELRRIRIPMLYDLGWEKPVPLAERALRFTVPERVDARFLLSVKTAPHGVVSVSPETTVRDVLETIAQHNVSQVPIMEEGQATGSATEAALMTAALRDAGILDRSVTELAEDPFPILPPTTDLAALKQTLARRTPAVLIAEDGHIEGILTRHDLLEYLAQ